MLPAQGAALQLGRVVASSSTPNALTVTHAVGDSRVTATLSFVHDGVLRYDLLEDRIFGAHREAGRSAVKAGELTEIPIPTEKARTWRVEADFVDAIRTGAPIQFTDFATGVAYMEFTEAVARSAEQGEPVELPLTEFAG